MRDTIVGHFVDRARRDGGRLALRELGAAGAPTDRSLSWREWEEESRAFAAALVAAGVTEGSRIAILAGNTTVWPIADLGTLMAAAVSVGVYPTSSSEQLQALLDDCGAQLLVVEGAAAWRTVIGLKAVPASLRRVIVRDVEVLPKRLGPASVGEWDDWLRRGHTALLGDAIAAGLQARMEAIRPPDLATLIYTSGSTGQPKGACLTHRYVTASAESVRDTLGLREDDSSLSFLPFAHAAERIFGLYTRVLVGMSAGLVRDHARVFDAARAFSPTLLGGVPRLFEKLYEALLSEESRAGASWTRALRLGLTRSRLRRNGEVVPPSLQRQWEGSVAPLRAWLSGLVGERLRLATSGGAALPTAVAETLDAVGITVLGAYGLTEHLCVAFNRPDAYAFDSVGTPMPGTRLRVAEDGELYVRRSDLTFSGYYGMADASAMAFTDDGQWLLTGDLAAIDDRGVVRITGRKKELIALSGGKKVAPLAIEARLVEDPWIAHAMCYGEGRRFLSALLFLRVSVVQEWARTQGLDCSAEDFTSHPVVLARVQAVLDRVNAQMASPERIKAFHLIGRELSADEGELTETMKLRRPVIAERFRSQLEALYA